ncbi:MULTISPECIES: endonuclease domain-containing protein [unclassified Methylobacterium]|jgi:hypothetical protein|uniref:endonuclease domain-containing protein n=1 Tax=unclassified Methylobacterium TaxID=2615210 RepID=UPI001353B9F5|nr:DUF559 domain-containing protein [Methylobacterium sp. 2A]MWV24627.1 DUF559 domain-containing protein [Methylobacterium sp. 2A]
MSPQLGIVARPQITAGDLARRIAALGPGERLVVLGAGRATIGALVSEGTERSALLVADADRSGTACIDQLLDDLADLARARWPHWHGRDASVAPVSADPWLKAAAKRARLGLAPRFRRLAHDLELRRLAQAIDPAGLVLIWEIDPASPARARPAIEALEWCARHGVASVAALAAEPPEAPPYDRILYGAHAFAEADRPVAERFIPAPGGIPASDIERRVATALGQDPDLAGLFVCNAPVPVGAWGARPRVDLLCPTLRVVVELDGPEHRAEPKFGADRHRDYELLTAGYLVLRLTNDQVAADLPLAIEKIRAVVRLRRAGGGFSR